MTSEFRVSMYRCVICLPVTFVHCAQTAEDIYTISFAHNSSISPCLSWII